MLDEHDICPQLQIMQTLGPPHFSPLRSSVRRSYSREEEEKEETEEAGCRFGLQFFPLRPLYLRSLTPRAASERARLNSSADKKTSPPMRVRSVTRPRGRSSSSSKTLASSHIYFPMWETFLKGVA